MRVKYSFETRKLRVYHPDSPEPNFWDGIGMVRLAGRAWFIPLKFSDLEEQLGLLQAEPKGPYEVQRTGYLLRRLKRIYPVLVLDPGWRNPRLNPRAEWLEALKELDQNLAQKVRQFIQGEGKREYLRQNSGR